VAVHGGRNGGGCRLFPIRLEEVRDSGRDGTLSLTLILRIQGAPKFPNKKK